MSLLRRLFHPHKTDDGQKEFSLSEAEERELKNGLVGLIKSARHYGSNAEETKAYVRETRDSYQSEGVRYYFCRLGAVLLLLQDRVDEEKRY